MKSFKNLFFVVSLAAFLQACGGGSDHNPAVVVDPVQPFESVVDVAKANGSFDTLVAALEATGLDQTLDDEEGNFTVFAPTDDAFALLGEDTINALLEDTDTLSNILQYHVAPGYADSTTATEAAGSKVEMVNGDSIALSLDGDTLLVNKVTVTAVDVTADNGIIHVIDAVLIPPTAKGEPTSNIVDTAVAAGSFTTLVAALQATGLDATLADETGQFTVFAPTDAAFAVLGDDTIAALLEDTDALSNILLQHVLSAEVPAVDAFTLNGSSVETVSGASIPLAIDTVADTLKFGGATVVTEDIYTSNGVIHVIDMVVIADADLPTPAKSIVDVAVEAGGFTTLVAALQATGLDTVLDDSASTFTVFAPSDAAFALLGEDTINALLADTDSLQEILLYHVVSDAEVLQDAAVNLANSANNTVATASADRAVALSTIGSTLYVNQSAVSTANIMADNGVIHVIDQVILPPAVKGEPSLNIVDTALSDSQFSTLVTALTEADLVSTLADETATFTVFAPTNDAFAKIETATLDGLLADQDALAGILLKHVISGAEVGAVAAYAANGSQVDSAGGDSLSVGLVNFTKTTNAANDEVAYDKVNQRLVGGSNSSAAGMTLYVFDTDLGSAGSNCSGGCATTWPPVLVTDDEVANISGLSLITRDDGTKQAAFQGRPLYFYANDTSAGDANGQGAGGVWWTADQAQVALQIQGSSVTTSNIFTTNGVIHVIDTVITD